MFGYVRPLVGEMRVRENEMYRAVYCGLCRSMGRHTGCASRMTLSYDFVFLCLLRAALTGERFVMEAHHCAAHPLKRRQMAADNPTIAYCAKAAAHLTAAKLEDDLADERGLRRAAVSALKPAANGMRRRAGELDALGDEITRSLDALAKLEAAGCDSLDETADCFGTLLGSVFAWGLDGSAERIATACGQAVGRYIYITDAADDAPKDAESGSYNPILLRYGKDCLTERETVLRSGQRKTKMRLALPLAQQLYTAAMCALRPLGAAVELIDFGRAQTETEGIVKNTVYLGMPAELRRVLALPADDQRQDTQRQESER